MSREIVAEASGLNLKQATALVRTVCEVAGARDLIEDTRNSLRKVGVVRAVQAHDDAVLFEWLAEATSYQGVSDRAAASFMERHGTVAFSPPCAMRLELILGSNVRRLRKAAGLSQEHLAADSKIDMRYLGGIERGQENPSLAVIGRIAVALKAVPAELLIERRLKR